MDKPQKKLRDFEGESLEEEAGLRREWLENEVGVSLKAVGESGVEEVWKDKNIENVVGSVRIPLGVAGPAECRIEGVDLEVLSEGRVYLPLATTEGALVASVSRGCGVIRKAGGARVVVEDMGMSRASVFRVSGVGEAMRVRDWVEKNEGLIEGWSREVSGRLKLKEARVMVAGLSVYVRMAFTTGEAMGMNMVTVAMDRVVGRMEQELGIECVSLSANVCCDKKPAEINKILGRGKRVWAEVVIPREMVERGLKAEVGRVVEVWSRKTMVGSVMAGSSGFNAQAANVVAAMFVATGQDLAHVVHGAEAVTTMEEKQGDLYAGVYIPSLPVGVVGGGTRGETQREGLGLMGLGDKPGDVLRLAGYVGVGVLAGELSLHGALASGDLALAHRSLGWGGRKSGGKQ